MKGEKIMKIKSLTVWIILLVPLVTLAQGNQTNKKENTAVQEKESLTPAQQALVKMWEEHTKAEFETKSTEQTLKTMIPGAHVNHVPVLTGGVGLEEVGEFYSRYFIPQMPPDTELTPVSSTIGTDQIVDEMIFKFTHTISMAWMLPGIPPTGKRVEVPLVAIIKFQDGKVAHEHIYWDQASVLVQIGLLKSDKLPVAGIESARKVIDPTSVPSNALIERSHTEKKP
jgi:carboxymethylenebutenolidase